VRLQNLWSLHDHYCVGIGAELRGEDLSCCSDVNLIVLVYENVYMVTNLPTKRI